MKTFEQFTESFLKDKIAHEVGSHFRKHVGDGYYDDSLSTTGTKSFVMDTKMGKVRVHHKEGDPANGKKVHRYNYHWED